MNSPRVNRITRKSNRTAYYLTIVAVVYTATTILLTINAL